MRRRRAERAAAWVLTVGIVAAGCSFGGSEPSSLEVFGPWRGAEANAFRRVLDGFTDETGIDVRYTGSSSFAARIRARVTEGDVPDVAVFPQIGLVNELEEAGSVLSLPAELESAIADSYAPAIGAFAASTPFAGVLVRVSVKSLVWYRPAVFEDLGYRIPATWAELEALTETIADADLAPWCLGVAAGDATGWPATDWVEDIVLRIQGPSGYDAWAAGEVPFTDPSITSAFDTFERLVLDTGEPAGGRSVVINTTPQRAQDPGLEDPPRCIMYRHASFHRGDLPDELDVGSDADVDVFVVPGLEAGAAPLVIGGDVAAAMTDRPETWELMAYLGSPDGARILAAQGDFVTPNGSIGGDDYARSFDARVASLIDDALVVRFDASDLMPPDVGTMTFYRAMVALIAGRGSAEAATLAQSGYGSG